MICYFFVCTVEHQRIQQFLTGEPSIAFSLPFMIRFFLMELTIIFDGEKLHDEQSYHLMFLVN